MSITIKRARQSVPLCLDLSLKSAHDRAVAALDEAKNEAARDSREADTSVRDAALVVFELERRMRAHTIYVELEALPRKRWVEFEESNPPREGNETDKIYSLNLSRLDDVITPSIVGVASAETGGEPIEFDPASWPELAEEMSQSQWEAFALAVLGLNRGSTTAPFSPAASLAILRSEPTSKRPSGSGSPSSGSAAGSRSRRTSTTPTDA